jgi:hypothetical protein
MNRKALIIGNPGIPGAENYCLGVEKDIENYSNYMRSPLGGLWQPHEITILRQPSELLTKMHIGFLSSVDYSMAIFCGHACHSNADDSTIVELKPGIEMDSIELRKGASRHTLILDCCRQIVPPQMLTEDVLAKALKAAPSINPAECRKYYDIAINQCPRGLAVLFACSIRETAGDSATQGGHYSYSLLSAADVWSREHRVDTTKECGLLSVVGAHDLAVPRVDRLSGGRQTPTIEKARSGPYFPFGIIA